MHCYEYCNTVGWFFDHFDHPRRLRFLFVAGSFVNCTARHQRLTGELQSFAPSVQVGTAGLGAPELLDAIEATICGLDGAEAMSLITDYLGTGASHGPLVQRLALAATRLGNDPHNQEIAQCMLEDYAKNRSSHRNRLLLACAQQTAAHRKYGDPLECSRRFGEALGISRLQ